MNVLLAKSFLQARGFTAATVPIENGLIDAAVEAHGKYVADQHQARLKRKAEEIALRTSEETKAIQAMCLNDEQRKRDLEKLEMENKKVVIPFSFLLTLYSVNFFTKCK